MAAFEAVEVGGGEVEEGGGFFQGEVVGEAEGTEAAAEVASAEGGADEEVEGMTVVGGELFAKGGVAGGIVEEKGGVVVEEVEGFEEGVWVPR